MSFFKRQPARLDDEPDTDDEAHENIDPQLRLRTVRTAASSIAEAGRIEDRANARRLKARGSRFFRRNTEKRKTTADSAPAPPPPPPAPAPTPAPTVVPGVRRNIYVNTPLARDELDAQGEPLVRYVRNKVRTSSVYTFASYTGPFLTARRVHHYHLRAQEPVRAIPTRRQHLLPCYYHRATYVPTPFRRGRMGLAC
jgi:phospholipid-translocating ATPase